MCFSLRFVPKKVYWHRQMVAENSSKLIVYTTMCFLSLYVFADVHYKMQTKKKFRADCWRRTASSECDASLSNFTLVMLILVVIKWQKLRTLSG